MAGAALTKIIRKAGAAIRLLAGTDALSVREFAARVHLRGSGIEVGALHNPMKLPRGAKARYVDRMSREDLLRHYPEHAGLKLVPVDIVSDGERLEGVDDATQDFVIANHFLEHCQDPVRALKNFLRVLRPGGVAFLTLPDKRGTFDRDRPETSYEHLLRDHREGPDASRRAHFEEWVSAVDKVPPERAAAEAARLMAADYSIHYHVFTGPGALEILLRLRRDENMDFAVEGFLQNGEEFVCILRKDEPAA